MAQVYHTREKKNSNDSYYDSPPKPAIFFNERSWLLGTWKGTTNLIVSIRFIVCKVLSIDDVGEGVEGHRTPGDTTGRAGFEISDFLREKLGGGLP